MHITKHAYERGKDRLGWKKNTLKRMTKRAWKKGLTYCDTKGQLKAFVDKKKQLYPFVDAIRIYGENIFFFSEGSLITLYRLDNELIKLVNVLQNVSSQ